MYVILIIMTTFQIGIVLFIIEKLRILVYHFFHINVFLILNLV